MLDISDAVAKEILKFTHLQKDADIAFAAGIPPKLLRHWLAEGEKETAARPYKEFYQQYHISRMKYKSDVVKDILEGENDPLKLKYFEGVEAAEHRREELQFKREQAAPPEKSPNRFFGIRVHGRPKNRPKEE